MKLRAQYEPENGLVRLKIPKDLKFGEQMANDFLKDLLEQCNSLLTCCWILQKTLPKVPRGSTVGGCGSMQTGWDLTGPLASGRRVLPG